MSKIPNEHTWHHIRRWTSAVVGILERTLLAIASQGYSECVDTHKRSFRVAVTSITNVSEGKEDKRKKKASPAVPIMRRSDTSSKNMTREHTACQPAPLSS